MGDRYRHFLSLRAYKRAVGMYWACQAALRSFADSES